MAHYDRTALPDGLTGWKSPRRRRLDGRKVLHHRVGLGVTGVHHLVILGEVELACEVLPLDAEADPLDARRAGLRGDSPQQRTSHPPATPGPRHADRQFR